MTDPTPPVLLTSLASAVLLDGSGDVTLARESRGAPAEWGGVYAQLVRLTGPWQVRLHEGDATADLPATLVGSSSAPGGWQSQHRWGRFTIDQHIAAIADPPGAVRTLRVSVADGPPATLTVDSRWSPFLLPVLIEGIRPVTYRAETRGESLEIHQREFALAFRSSVLPSQYYLNHGSWIGGHYAGRVDAIGSSHDIRVAPGSPAQLTFLIHGGLGRDLARRTAIDTVLADPFAAADAVGSLTSQWEARTPTLRFPQDPTLERAYAFARSSLRRLYTEPGDGLVGLVAGYPWYSAIWCRDLAWMLPAVLWLGDFDWVARSLDAVFRFQAHADIPILGGERGELPMQVSPGPIFLYGTSDTTLYYPDLVDRFIRHSARASDATRWFPVVEEILAWGERRTDPASGLVRNGGEAHSIGAVSESLAHIQYGIDAADTTIWDSTDRRDHAIDLQVLWHSALLAGARRLEEPAGKKAAARRRALAERLRQTVLHRYPWNEESYLFDSLGPTEPVRKLRPNALRAISAGWFEPTFARAVVHRAEKEDLSTPWGMRTLSSEHPTYDPQAYHDGQVWTIATAWAADAALAAGETDLGLRYLDTIADRITREQGFANECYRGDRAEPFDSCFLLGFSIAPFLTVLYERLWGLRVDAEAGRLEVRPAFPEHWTSASLDGLTIGAGTVDLDWAPGRLGVRWWSDSSLVVATSTGETTIRRPDRHELALR